jgi:hypothetical protein
LTRFNLIFSDLQQFIKALKIICGEKIGRYLMIIAKIGRLVVVEPNVSTPGLNTLILRNLTETDEEIIKGIATNLGMEVIECENIEGEERKPPISS